MANVTFLNVSGQTLDVAYGLAQRTSVPALGTLVVQDTYSASYAAVPNYWATIPNGNSAAPVYAGGTTYSAGQAVTGSDSKPPSHCDSTAASPAGKR